MATKFIPSSTGEQWISGTTYRITYDVDHIKLFGITLPDELVPETVREYLARKQVSQTVDKLSSDPRFDVLGYEYFGRTFVVTLLARDNPFPIGIVVGGIIALALIFGIALVTKSVEKLVIAIGDVIEKAGPLAFTSISIAVLAAVGIGGYIILRRGL
jgi:hypothetical protein